MPELPEVETTRRGIEPYLVGHYILGLDVRERRLRWPVPAEIGTLVAGRQIVAVDRRGKYLLLRLEEGTLILHLGMSGSLQVLPVGRPAGKHDHLDLVLSNGRMLRLRDPRRFGALLWSEADPLQHSLLRDLGPEPLSDDFDGDYLYGVCGGRRASIKTLIMDSRVVVGVGNIYANEALFVAGIHPARESGRISRVRCGKLATAIKQVLDAAVAEGGTTLRDFVREAGQPGYFALQLQVYGRAEQPCPACGEPIRQERIGQRSSFFCTRCQR